MKNDEMEPQVAELTAEQADTVAGGQFHFWDWVFGTGGAGAKDA